MTRPAIGTPRREHWLDLLPADPRPVLLASDELPARFVALTALADLSEADAEAAAVRRALVADPAMTELVGRLQPWAPGLVFGGHQSPAYPPALLRLLHDLGVRAGDFPAIEAHLDAMLAHQSGDKRFLTPGKAGAAWTSLPCDHFAILETLLLFGRGDAPAVARGLERVAETLADTTQGPAWHCLPDPVAKWRGPGRKADACLGVTVEALRLYALVPPGGRPDGLAHAGRTLLGAWRRRETEKPYMFGHGRRFIAGKWPPTWYDASAMLGALAHYPDVWTGTRASADDTKSVVEIATALATVFSPDGLVTPQSVFRDFEGWSFGQKKHPSHWATARLCAILRRFSPVLGKRTT